MAKRIKPQPVKTKEEALEIIDNIARAQISLRAKSAEYAERMLELQETIGMEVGVMKDAIAALIDRVAPYIEKYGEAELFKAGQREGETALARFGVRLGNPTVVKDRRWTWDALAEELEKTHPVFTTTKVTADKLAILKAWRENQAEFDIVRQTYGIEVRQTDSAWVEAKGEDVADDGAMEK